MTDSVATPPAPTRPSATQVAGIPITAAGEAQTRICALIWGLSGTGKTTLACTAPGKKLLLSFDSDGAASVRKRNDVFVVDLASATPQLASRAQEEDVFGLKGVLNDYDTVICDSLTSFAGKALAYGVSQVRGATLVQPQKQGYGFRTGLTYLLVDNLIRLTGKLNKHVIFIAHEDAPDLGPDGTIAQITFMLGGQLPSTVPIPFSEIWYLMDDGRERRIAVRPYKFRQPMKTRMFITAKDPSFVWKYNNDKPDDAPENIGTRIADWFSSWQKGEKINLPT